MNPFRWIFNRPRQHNLKFNARHWLRSHAGIFGQTNSGKSTLLMSLYYSELKQINTSSSVLIDPHGDLAKRLFQLNTDKELIYISPSFGASNSSRQSTYAVLNPFEVSHQKGSSINMEFQALSLAESLHELMPDLSSNMLILLNACCLTLMQMKNVDLRDLVRFLDNRTMSPYLQYAQAHLSQDMLKFFLENYFTPAKRTREAIAYRLMGLLSATSFSRLVCGKSTISLPSLMNGNHHLLFDLSGLPRANADAFGKFILAQLKSIYLLRARQSLSKRRRIRLWIDEAPRFLGASFAEILQESRKFGLVTTFASQSYLQNLKPAVREAIRTNTSIKITGNASHQSLNAFADDTQADPEQLHRLNNHRFFYHYNDQATNKDYTFRSLNLNKVSSAWLSQEQQKRRRTHILETYYRHSRLKQNSTTHSAPNRNTPSGNTTPTAPPFFPLH